MLAFWIPAWREDDVNKREDDVNNDDVNDAWCEDDANTIRSP